MYPLDIPGISSAPRSIGMLGSEFVFNMNANKQTIVRLVSELPPATTLVFFDRDYSSPSDPGAYVETKRKKAKYKFQRANHGWSTRWKTITAQDLVEYIAKCARTGFPEPMFCYTITEQSLVSELLSEARHQLISLASVPKDWKLRLELLFLVFIFGFGLYALLTQSE